MTNEGYYGDDSFLLMQPSHYLDSPLSERGLDEDPNLLVVWDGKLGSTGGTGELVEAWRGAYNEPEVIDPADILSDVSESTKLPKYSGETKPAFISKFDEQCPGKNHQNNAFTGVQAFSQVVEERTGEFVQVFHGGIAEMMDRLSCKPAFVNTWGIVFLRFLMNLKTP